MANPPSLSNCLRFTWRSERLGSAHSTDSPGAGLSAVLVGHKIFALGSLSARSRLSFSALDCVGKRWKSLNRCKNLPKQRGLQTAWLYRDSIIIFGGSSQSSRFSNCLYRYDIITNEWSECEQSGSIPTPRRFHSGNYIERTKECVVYGGQTGKGTSDELLALSMTSFRWRLPKCTGKSPGKIEQHATCEVGETVYIFGGYQEDYLNTLHLLNPGLNGKYKWSTPLVYGSYLPPPREGATLSKCGTRLFLVGGNGNESIEDLSYYSLAKQRWIKVQAGQFLAPDNASSSSQSPKVRFHAGVYSQSKLYILGGYRGCVENCSTLTPVG